MAAFDPFHVGHLYHLQAARELGDKLYVSVTIDEFVDKGPGRPVFNLFQRMNVIKALRCVDEVYESKDALTILKFINPKPSVFVKGMEYRGKIDQDIIDYCAANNIEIAFTNTPQWSSTGLLNYYDRLRKS